MAVNVSVAPVAPSTARWATLADSATWRPISPIDEDSSSAAAATVCTLEDVVCEACATVLDRVSVEDVSRLMASAELCISVAVPESVRTT